MSRIGDNRPLLLQGLARMGSFGAADIESGQTFRQTYLPIAEHLRALEPDVALVLGARGAGKTELFRVAVRDKLLAAVARTTPELKGQWLEHQTDWLQGHPWGNSFPDELRIREFLSARQDQEAGSDFWFAYLLRVARLHKSFPSTDGAFKSWLGESGADAAKTIDAFRALGVKPLQALDDLDAQLTKENRRLMVGYDDLDVIGGADWDAMTAFIRGLIRFWTSYFRRWQRIRPKIFLRTDLFRRYGALFGAELAKIASSRVEITWSDRNLYAMLVKRIANTSQELADYCRRSKIRFDEDPDLGLIPRIKSAEDTRYLIESLAGQFMGANHKKGRTFFWLLEHIKDGNGHGIPRALVRLIERAAANEELVPKAAGGQLLDHRSIRRALDEVSREYVTSVNTHELPWLPGVAERMEGGLAPLDRDEVEDRLRVKWSRTWGDPSGTHVSVPSANASGLIDLLRDLGVLSERANGKIDVPDLYLAGLRMSRKGGVRRR